MFVYSDYIHPRLRLCGFLVRPAECFEDFSCFSLDKKFYYLMSIHKAGNFYSQEQTEVFRGLKFLHAWRPPYPSGRPPV